MWSTTDEQTDIGPRHIPRYSIASRGKNRYNSDDTVHIHIETVRRASELWPEFQSQGGRLEKWSGHRVTMTWWSLWRSWVESRTSTQPQTSRHHHPPAAAAGDGCRSWCDRWSRSQCTDQCSGTSRHTRTTDRPTVETTYSGVVLYTPADTPRHCTAFTLLLAYDYLRSNHDNARSVYEETHACSKHRPNTKPKAVGYRIVDVALHILPLLLCLRYCR